jgi:hypothetical protein
MNKPLAHAEALGGPRTASPEGAGEHPVFVSTRGRRALVVRTAVAAMAVVVLAWVAAIGAGLLGVGTLPGLPHVGGKDHQSPRSRVGAGGKPGSDTVHGRPLDAAGSSRRTRSESASQPSGRNAQGGRGRTEGLSTEAPATGRPGLGSPPAAAPDPVGAAPPQVQGPATASPGPGSPPAAARDPGGAPQPQPQAHRASTPPGLTRRRGPPPGPPPGLTKRLEAVERSAGPPG